MSTTDVLEWYYRYRALRNEVKIIDLHFSLVERPEKKLGSGGVCS